MAHSFCTAVKRLFWIQETLLRLSDVERSVVLRSVFAIGSALAYLLFFQECATPPLVQVRHTTWLSFTRPSPALVLQATNAGARRPGYEATISEHIWLAKVYAQATVELPSVKGPAGLFQLNVVNSVAVRQHVFFKMLFHPAQEWSGIHGTPWDS